MLSICSSFSDITISGFIGYLRSSDVVEIAVFELPKVDSPWFTVRKQQCLGAFLISRAKNVRKNRSTIWKL